MVYCIGLTGNIASGKSTVAKVFKELGVAVFNADTVAKQITLKGTKAYNEIVQHFGTIVLTQEQQLDRKKLRDIIFNQEKERIWLEQLLHPEIRQHLEYAVASCKGPYSIVEIPLLKNRIHYPYIQRVLVVISSIEIQVQRIIDRDKCTESQALSIIATQPSINERLAYADDILENNLDLEHLKHAIQQLHLNYLALANNF